MSMRYVLAFAVCCSFAGCKVFRDLKKEKELVSSDGVSSLKVPSMWIKHTRLNDVAAIQASTVMHDLFVITISEAKSDFVSMSLKKYSRLTRDSMTEKMPGADVRFLKKFKLNGMTAIQHRIEGTFEGLRFVYLHTAIEGRKHYHYILNWCLQSKFQAGEPVFQKIVGSFKERRTYDDEE